VADYLKTLARLVALPWAYGRVTNPTDPDEVPRADLEGAVVPVGAEIVSRSLTAVPQFETLTLRFSNYWTPADLRRRISHGAEVEVVCATYLRANCAEPKSGTYGCTRSRRSTRPTLAASSSSKA
jgi:hypothetical protein